jgi:hypothetical protein
MSTMATKLNERNYRQWAIEAKAVLHAQGLWKYVSGAMRVPRPPIVATSDASSATTPTARDPRDTEKISSWNRLTHPSSIISTTSSAIGTLADEQ